MTVKRLSNIKLQYDDGNGVLASNYRLFFYAAGSSTKQNTYNSSAGSVANANPIVLNALGEPAVEIWLTAGQSYKVGLAIPGSDDPPASFVWTEDNITGVNDTTSVIDQWIAGVAPTFISAVSFSLVGDQTSIYHVGRRLKTINSGGTVYSTISASAFGVVTTVTVVNDSGTLDAGLSAVSYGVLSAVNPSTPLLTDAYPIVSGSADKTKLVRLEVDGLTTGTTRVLTVQDSNDTLVGRATTDTLTNKTLTSPVIDTAVTGTAVASQAQMETGTATNLIVTPGRLQNHPGVVKGWVQAGVSADIASSYNVNSLTDGGSGIVTVTWETDMSGTNYNAMGTAKAASTGTSFYCPFISNTSFAAGTTRMDVWHGVTGSQAPIDPTHFMILVLGDQ